MTTTQTIDGVLVSCELLKVALGYPNNGDEMLAKIKAREELRALLDAPAHPCPVQLDGCDGSCTPAAQPQGEPVAWVEIAGDGSFWPDSYTTENMSNASWYVPLYAEQPAPVAVVMPERSDFEKIAERECMERLGRFVPARSADGYRNQTTALLFAVWQRCLDEVTRLNAKSR